MNILTRYGYKDINDVNIGDELVAYDINDGHIIYNTLLDKELWTENMYDGFYENHGDFTYYEVNGTWKLYKNQSVWANLNVIHASQLKIGDVIYDDQDNDIVVTSITELTEINWWRLTVSGDHSYVADGITLHNASRYWVGGGSGGNWSSTGNTNWGSSSGTKDNASVPTSADDVIFDGAGTTGNTNSNISVGITILSLNITTGYTATMTHTNNLTIAGNWTFTSNYTIAGVSSVIISANSTITSNGRTWPNSLTFNTTNTTITLPSLLTVNNTITISGANVTFSGTDGFDTLTLSGTTGSTGTLTLQNGITYTIRNAFSAASSRLGAILTITSNDATNRAFLVLKNGATCTCLANFTRIDASGGRTINSFNGTITDCLNVRSFTDLQSVGGSF